MPSEWTRIEKRHEYLTMAKEDQIRAYNHALFRALGPQNWWPARTRFEVIVGAYLTQITSWTNVERALRQLRFAGLLSIHSIRAVSLKKLEPVIRPAGYFRQKARRLKTFVAFLDQFYAGSLALTFAQPTEKLRQEQLELDGIGPETADSILLYAGQHPIFVVDAYTRRICGRHGSLPENTPYEVIRQLWESALSGIGDTDISPFAETGKEKLVPGLTVHRAISDEPCEPASPRAGVQRYAWTDRADRQALLSEIGTPMRGVSAASFSANLEENDFSLMLIPAYRSYNGTAAG